MLHSVAAFHCNRQTTEIHRKPSVEGADSYLQEEQRCRKEEPDPQACVERAYKAEHDGFNLLFAHQWKENLQAWSVYAIGALFCAYLAALCARTIGWIALGFRSPA